ncbi:hypothetical protein E2C01_023208 [Portunus trituberculatus]|uniref:Uncharacterized protein n=1 Tax=Portunus trituberculatus TaxID=210409 RepID=A0A5B7EAJ1_PORTR|nr:hypothetical protein [Portunus trituberculatus]
MANVSREPESTSSVSMEEGVPDDSPSAPGPAGTKEVNDGRVQFRNRFETLDHSIQIASVPKVLDTNWQLQLKRD